ncbi:hypothetical protein ETD86_31830 [Nonomuraea turkmeniaca]|uniref:Uncharacterized protein n=1 Tax=Nonomuraea turkmeniaca TaxID=103838 RepID=A0A5S4F8K2_9ACTN|nr:hypothetical protein [Nonomuraea turkmeniaca]TMR12777.1 hypothetical protein ETD86_31830 [Nonomuraea turkmeniaca]
MTEVVCDAGFSLVLGGWVRRREEFFDALSLSATAEATAMKRLVIDFEAALARLVLSRQAEDQVDRTLEEFLVEDYVQHDPNVPGNGRAILAGRPTPR